MQSKKPKTKVVNDYDSFDDTPEIFGEFDGFPSVSFDPTKFDVDKMDEFGLFEFNDF